MMTDPERKSGDRSLRALRLAAVIGAPALAIGIAWWATRSNGAPAAASGGHDHSAATAPRDSAHSVMLDSADQRRIGVTYAPVEFGPLADEVRTVGQVTVDETRVRTISTKVDGWVERLHVDYTGQAVGRAAPLLDIYSPMLVTAQEELLLALRLSRDVAHGSADARASAEDLVASARRRLSWWDIPGEQLLEIERAGEVQRTLTLNAPTAGVVIEKNVTVGQRVMAGDVLYRVADLSSVWVESEVYEQDLRFIRVGQVATADFDAMPGERFTGRIAYVYPTLTPETRTARVRMLLPNEDRRLKPGMYATLHLTGAAGQGVLNVPRGAVLATGEWRIVFVRRPDGHLEPRQVHVGRTSDDRVEIIDGLALGETVVASATFLVDAESNLGTALGGMGDMPGMEVTIPPRQEPRSPR